MTDEGVRNTIARMKRDGLFHDDEDGDGRLVINLNDCFGWAMADGEDITDRQRPYAEAYEAHGFTGVFALAAIERGYDPEPGHLGLMGQGYEDEWRLVKRALEAQR